MALQLRVPQWLVLLLTLALQSLILIKAEIRTFLWFSDIHYDPYYGGELAISHNKLNASVSCATLLLSNPYGDFGCDSPLSLMEEVLRESARVQDADFVIITGDFVRHNNDELPSPMDTTQQILKNVSASLLHHHPHIPIVPSLGNNDVTPDYYLDIDNPDDMLNMVTGGLGHLLKNETIHFRQGGFYARQVTPQLRILSLNTIFYSTNHQPYSTNKDPLGQFFWLVNQLQDANHTNTSVYIIGHIPPTVGSYRHTQLWQEQYLDRYYAIVGQYSHVVKGQLFGHIHSEEFRVHNTFPLFLTSSFTPIYGSNPSFRVVTYDNETNDLLDYQVHYFDLALLTQTANNDNHTNNNTQSMSPQWQVGLFFTEAFGVPDMSYQSLQSIVQDLQSSTDHQHWQALLTRLHAFAHGSEVCEETCRQEWACTLSSMTAEQYKACLPHSASSSKRWILTLVVAIAAVVLVGLAFQRYLQRRHYQSTPPVELQEIDHVWDEKSEEFAELPRVT